MRVLVVEDEKKIALLIQRGLRECGFAVDMVHHGDQALEIILDHHFDAVVLDVMLPGHDGLSILRALRQKRHAVPVIILTARGEISEKVEGLDLGADDYLAKPFSVEELIARLRAVIRIRPGRSSLSERGQERPWPQESHASGSSAQATSVLIGCQSPRQRTSARRAC